MILYLVYDDGDPPGWDSTRYYTCAACGRYWKEEFVEAMQYNANHMYPMDVDEIKKLLQNPKVNSNINK